VAQTGSGTNLIVRKNVENRPDLALKFEIAGKGMSLPGTGKTILA
jgi:hypothetical protein